MAEEEAQASGVAKPSLRHHISPKKNMTTTDSRLDALRREYTAKIDHAIKQVENWNSLASLYKTKLEVLSELESTSPLDPEAQQQP